MLVCHVWLQDPPLPTLQDWPELTGPDGNDALEREMAAREVELRVLRKAAMIGGCGNFLGFLDVFLVKIWGKRMRHRIGIE